MKIRILEIFAITLFVLGIAINLSYQNSYDDFAMVRITVPLIYFLGGYFIFKPKKEIKYTIRRCDNCGIHYERKENLKGRFCSYKCAGSAGGKKSKQGKRSKNEILLFYLD